MSFRMHLIALVGLAMVGINPSHGQAPASIHQVKMTDIDGRPVDLSRYKGKVVLLVNVASECGYTPQYKGLQDLHNKYGKDGLVILGVPCNDFGAQEPGTEAQIKPAQTMIKITGKGQVNAEVKYPPPTQVIDDKIVGKYRVYEGRIEIPVTVQGSGPIEVGVRYQPCDDKRCLPTKTFTQTVP
jgi:hypothetical protein